MHTVIFTGGKFVINKKSQEALEAADLCIAADSGADTAIAHSIFPSVLVGDMDSVSSKTKEMLRKRKCQFISFPQEKDETDTELAIQYALTNGATQITLLGGMDGNRIDHIIGNLLFLTLIPVPVVCFNNNQSFRSAHGPTSVTISGKKNDVLSLIPLHGDVFGISTEGLFYALDNGTLLFGKPRGLSNVLTRKKAIVSFEKGILLLVHTTKG